MSAIIEGKGKVLLCLHGYLSCKESFVYQINFFSQYYKVVAIDLDGFGENNPLDKPYSLDDYVNSVVKIIDCLNVNNLDIIAHSFGARIACKLALVDNRIDRIVFTGSAGLKPKRSLKYYFNILSYKLIKRFLNEEQKQKFGSSEFRSLNTIMKQSYLKIVNEHLDKKYRLINNYCLIIFGDKDKETPLYMAKRQNKFIKKSNLYIINDSDHFCFLYKYLEFNYVVKEFLLTEK